MERPPLTPSGPEQDLLFHVCWICGKPTGATSRARDHIIKPGEWTDAMNHMYRYGLCPAHDKMRVKGHTSFISDTRGVMLKLEANEKIQPEYQGKVIHIPEDKMDEILKTENDYGKETGSDDNSADTDGEVSDILSEQDGCAGNDQEAR